MYDPHCGIGNELHVNHINDGDSGILSIAPLINFQQPIFSHHITLSPASSCQCITLVVYQLESIFVFLASIIHRRRWFICVQARLSGCDLSNQAAQLGVGWGWVRYSKWPPPYHLFALYLFAGPRVDIAFSSHRSLSLSRERERLSILSALLSTPRYF